MKSLQGYGKPLYLIFHYLQSYQLNFRRQVKAYCIQILIQLKNTFHLLIFFSEIFLTCLEVTVGWNHEVN
jgi:uncharacterized membrane protein YesL